MKGKVLIADDQLNMRKILKAILTREGYEVNDAADGLTALDMALHNNFHAVITDLRMPGMSGLDILQELSDAKPRLPVILITAHGTIETAVEAMKSGAFDYITKPFEKEEIVQTIAKAVKTFNLSEHEFSGEGEADGRYALIGNSRQMQDVYTIIDKVAPSPTTILILGESGTGKELIAKAIHENSLVKDKPFIKINCAAIPENLLESELFGYEKGAFTGAATSKPGRFELADGGTLFLDEIGEISKEMQVKLLRCIQEQEFERVGGIKTIRVNVRLLAATNSDLELKVEQGRFRQDLFYRLNVVPILLPPLRERREDIPLLITHFLEKFNTKLNKQIHHLDDEVKQYLMHYSWPGNIRELENIMERAVLLSENETISVSDIPKTIAGGTEPPSVILEHSEDLSLKDTVKKHTQAVEKALIISVLNETDGNVTQAAKKLKISRKSLQTKMKEYRLRDEY